MRLSTRTIIPLGLVVVWCLALGASAWAAPAGDEYLPKVPDATGHDASASRGGGGNGGSSAPLDSSSSSTGATAPVTSPSDSSGGPDKSHKDSKKDKVAKAPPAKLAVDSSDNSGDGSSGLFTPIVLLIVAGVIVAAVGMTLRHRAGGPGDEPEGDSRRDAGQPPSARPTPDGEIFAGGDKA
jgi:hypothetical protein